MIIRTRRRLIRQWRRLSTTGRPAPGVDNPAVYRQRSGEIILPRSVDWWEGSQSLREKSLANPPELAIKTNA